MSVPEPEQYEWRSAVDGDKDAVALSTAVLLGDHEMAMLILRSLNLPQVRTIALVLADWWLSALEDRPVPESDVISWLRWRKAIQVAGSELEGEDGE